jgi:demethylmenaquinone methyltransferase/2-methoxy-6-polyprenyl-1,4-benzoquinol methylase
MEKLNIGLIFGGKSSEHEVSCASAASIIKNIDKEKYDVTKIWIDKRGVWYVYEGPTEYIENATLGTGYEDARLIPAVLSPCSVTGGLFILDKINSKYSPLPDYILASAEDLPFEDSKFDATTISFGIRNFNNRPLCLKEIYRVIKPGGVLAILEFAKPKNAVIRFIYNLYFNNILPFIGRVVSKDKEAYKYLSDSVEAFPKYNAFCSEIKEAGFKDVKYKKLTFGICVLYTGKKQE